MQPHLLLIAITATAVAFPCVGYAEEQSVPAFKSPPAKYVSRYDGEMLIGDRDSKSLTFWLQLTGQNYHVCGMAGQATSWDKEHYRYSKGDCTLEIILLGKSAVLIDQGHQCKTSHCGSRAYIDGTVLFQKSDG